MCSSSFVGVRGAGDGSEKAGGGGNWPENVLISFSDFLRLKNFEISESLLVRVRSLLAEGDGYDCVCDQKNFRSMPFFQTICPVDLRYSKPKSEAKWPS